MQVAIDKEYLIRTIDLLLREKSEHDKKFAGNPHHKDCLPRFDKVIDQLTLELDKVTIQTKIK